MSLGTSQARARVEARLGRAPQDPLESTVVLEAWGGVSTRHAFDVSTATVGDESRARARPGVPRLPKRDPAEGVALLVAFVVTAGWMVPLARTLHRADLHVAWSLGLPLSLALQAFIRVRYLAGKDGIGRLRQAVLPVSLVLTALVALIASIGRPGIVAAALVVVSVGSVVIVRRGWVLVHVAVLGSSYALLATGLPGTVDAGIALAGMVVVLAAALATVPRSSRPAGPWSHALVAAASGGAVGALLAFESSELWNRHGPLAVVALLPSFAGAAWAAAALGRLWEVLPERMWRAPIRPDDRTAHARTTMLARAATGVVLGAVARFAVATAALSAGLAAGVGWLGAEARGLHTILLAVGAIAAVNLSVIMLDALGKPLRGLGVVACAWAVTATTHVAGVLTHHDGALLLGTAVALVVAAAAVVPALRRPDRVFALRL